MATTLERLASWYLRHCDGDWEHASGIKIDTYDNPGWGVKIDLRDTELEDEPFDTFQRDPDHELLWLRCWKEGPTFHAACGPGQLESALEVFLAWAECPRAAGPG